MEGSRIGEAETTGVVVNVIGYRPAQPVLEIPNHKVESRNLHVIPCRLEHTPGRQDVLLVAGPSDESGVITGGAEMVDDMPVEHWFSHRFPRTNPRLSFHQTIERVQTEMILRQPTIHILAIEQLNLSEEFVLCTLKRVTRNSKALTVTLPECQQAQHRGPSRVMIGLAFKPEFIEQALA